LSKYFEHHFYCNSNQHKCFCNGYAYAIKNKDLYYFLLNMLAIKSSSNDMYMLQSIYFKLTSLLLWDFPHFRRNNGALCTNPFINQSRYLFYDYPISAVDCSSSVANDNPEEVPKQVNKAFPRQLIYLSASILIYLPKCIVNLNASRGFSPRTSAIQKSITPLPRPIHKFLPF